MLLTQRALTIVFLLYQQNQALTSSQLADSLNVTERTVKSDIAGMLHMHTSYGFRIISRKSIGYELCIIDEAKFHQHILPYLMRYADAREIPMDSHTRMRQVLCLLFQKECITSDEVASILFLDRRTLHKTFLKVRHHLQRYHLELISRPNMGFHIYGKELHKRLCMIDMYTYYQHRIHPDTSSALHALYFSHENMRADALRNVLLHQLRLYPCSIKDIHSQKLVYHVFLCLQREAHGFPLQISEDERRDIVQWKEYGFICQVCTQLQETFHIVIGSNERYYLSIILLSCLDVQNEDDMQGHDDVIELLDEISDDICTRLKAQFHCAKLPDVFEKHLRNALFPVLVRMHYAVYEDNEWLRQWRFQSIYPSHVALEMAFLTTNIISHHIKAHMGSDDIAQLAFIFHALIDQQLFPFEKRRILIIPSSGQASTYAITAKLQHNFADSIACIDIMERYKIKDVAYMKPYDILISYPEYCADFEDVIHTLYIQDILDYDYNELYNKLIMSGLHIHSYIPDICEDSFHTLPSARDMMDALGSILFHHGHDKAAVDAFLKRFEEREEVIFNRRCDKQVCFFLFVKKEEQEQFYITKMEKPFLWQQQKIQQIIICFIHADALEKCRIYDTLLTRMLMEPQWLKRLWKEKNADACMTIMQQSH